MKNFIAAVLILALCVFGMVVNVSADNGTPVGNRTYTLFSSQAVATGASYTSTAATFDNPMNSFVCDVIASNGTGTGTISIDGNAGSSTTSFYSGSLYSAVKTAATFTTFYITGKPARIIRATFVTGPATTNIISVNCAGVQ